MQEKKIRAILGYYAHPLSFEERKLIMIPLTKTKRKLHMLKNGYVRNLVSEEQLQETIRN